MADVERTAQAAEDECPGSIFGGAQARSLIGRKRALDQLGSSSAGQLDSMAHLHCDVWASLDAGGAEDALAGVDRRDGARYELDGSRRAGIDASAVVVAERRIDLRQPARGVLEKRWRCRIAGRLQRMRQRPEQSANYVEWHVSGPCRHSRARSSC